MTAYCYSSRTPEHLKEVGPIPWVVPGLGDADLDPPGMGENPWEGGARNLGLWCRSI